jgi:hypothetical protein
MVCLVVTERVYRKISGIPRRNVIKPVQSAVEMGFPVDIREKGAAALISFL